MSAPNQQDIINAAQVEIIQDLLLKLRHSEYIPEDELQLVHDWVRQWQGNFRRAGIEAVE